MKFYIHIDCTQDDISNLNPNLIAFLITSQEFSKTSYHYAPTNSTATSEQEAVRLVSSFPKDATDTTTLFLDDDLTKTFQVLEKAYDQNVPILAMRVVRDGENNGAVPLTQDELTKKFQTLKALSVNKLPVDVANFQRQLAQLTNFRGKFSNLLKQGNTAENDFELKPFEALSLEQISKLQNTIDSLDKYNDDALRIMNQAIFLKDQMSDADRTHLRTVQESWGKIQDLKKNLIEYNAKANPTKSNNSSSSTICDEYKALIELRAYFEIFILKPNSNGVKFNELKKCLDEMISMLDKLVIGANGTSDTIQNKKSEFHTTIKVGILSKSRALINEILEAVKKPAGQIRAHIKKQIESNIIKKDINDALQDFIKHIQPLETTQNNQLLIDLAPRYRVLKELVEKLGDYLDPKFISDFKEAEQKYVECKNKISAASSASSKNPKDYIEIDTRTGAGLCAKQGGKHNQEDRADSKKLPNFPKDQAMQDKVITETLASLNQSIAHKMLTDGSCLIQAIIDPNSEQVITVALGDSSSLLVNIGNSVTATRINKWHHPNDKNERAYIESNGGTVTLWGKPRLNATLAVSRAMGDTSLKPALNQTPDIYRTALPDDKISYVVVVSDGITDVLSSDEIANIIELGHAVGKSLDKIAETIVNTALKKGSEDNCSAIVDKYDPAKPGVTRAIAIYDGHAGQATAEFLKQSGLTNLAIACEVAEAKTSAVNPSSAISSVASTTADLAIIATQKKAPAIPQKTRANTADMLTALVPSEIEAASTGTAPSLPAKKAPAAPRPKADSSPTPPLPPKKIPVVTTDAASSDDAELGTGSSATMAGLGSIK